MIDQLKEENFKGIPIKDFENVKKNSLLATYKDLPVEYN